MNFAQLKSHLEDNACSVDHIEENRYGVMNCINAEYCEIEDLSDYSRITLCHYFYELGVSSPVFLRDFFYVYSDFRSKLAPVETEEE